MNDSRLLEKNRKRDRKSYRKIVKLTRADRSLADLSWAGKGGDFSDVSEDEAEVRGRLGFGAPALPRGSEIFGTIQMGLLKRTE